MHKLSEIIKQPEGRKLEFKETLPTNADLSRTIIAFANDAGGELYIGIKDNPREITGISENERIALEEKISNIIHDSCEPIVLPEITFLTHESKHIIKVQTFKRVGIIEQWGNGLRIIADELLKYPEIGKDWKEPGIEFRVTFSKKNFIPDTSEEIFTDTSGKMSGKMSGKTSGKILELIASNSNITIPEIAKNIGLTERSVERNIQKLQANGKLKREGAAKGGHWEIIND